MGSIIDGEELIRRHMCIFLCCAQRGVPEHFLYGAEIRAFVEQVRCVGMPQSMRTYRSADETAGVPRNNLSDAPSRDPASTMI